MKRKYADRADWARVLRRRFVIAPMSGDGISVGVDPTAGLSAFDGWLAAVAIEEVSHPLVVRVDGQNLTLAECGYLWLQHLPRRGHHCLTTAFDPEGNLVQWYFDVVKEVGQTPEGRVYFDDLYLDVIATPGGEPELLDEDELEQALDERLISHADFDLAYKETQRILRGPLGDPAALARFCRDSYSLAKGQLSGA